MSDARGRLWSTRRRPGGEVELTVKGSALSDARLRPGIIACGAFAMGGLALINDPPVPVLALVSWLLGVVLLGYAWFYGRTQVWWLKPGMATVSPGHKDEAAYFVNEVRLEHTLDSDGERHANLQLITPAKAVDVGAPYQREEVVRAIGEVMAKALEVDFTEARR